MVSYSVIASHLNSACQLFACGALYYINYLHSGNAAGKASIGLVASMFVSVFLVCTKTEKKLIGNGLQHIFIFRCESIRST